MTKPRPVLSPEAKFFLDTLDALGARDAPWNREVSDRREEAGLLAAKLGGPAQELTSITDLHVGGVPARLYSPHGDERHVLVWFHGGGWIVGELAHHDALASALANHAGCAVLSVGYRLAPEHAYPSAVDDCWAATIWASQRFERVAVGGDSSGGNLAAVIALKARDQGLQIALQLLIYPALDPALESPFIAEFISKYKGFAGQATYGEDSRRGVRQIWEMYIPDQQRRLEPDASPIHATSHSGVAPATIILAEHDILRGDGEAYAQLLQAEGVPATVRIYNGQVHGFYHLLGSMDDAVDAVNYSASELHKAFTETSPL